MGHKRVYPLEYSVPDVENPGRKTLVKILYWRKDHRKSTLLLELCATYPSDCTWYGYGLTKDKYVSKTTKCTYQEERLKYSFCIGKNIIKNPPSLNFDGRKWMDLPMRKIWVKTLYWRKYHEKPLCTWQNQSLFLLFLQESSRHVP